MNRRIRCLFILSIIFFSACSKSNSSSPGSGYADVVYVNSAETGSKIIPLDGKANSTIVTGAGSLTTLSNSGYQSITAGTENLSWWLTGGSELISLDSSLGYNLHYSYFICGPLSAPKGVLSVDDLNIPNSGYAKVRFANFCSGNPSLSFSFGTSVLDSGHSYIDPFLHIIAPYVTGFTEVPAGTNKLLAQDPTQTNFAAVLPNQTFVAEKIYTVIFTDSSTDGTSGFYLLVVTNQ